MRRPSPLDEKSRFSGQLRHYHRSGAGIRPSWETWVDGEESKPASWGKLFGITGAVVLVLVVGAIAAGLIIVLR